jgi:type I restriction enzyme, S subunit
MNPDLFFENFELLADAPNGVQKLRELILQLAVMGKLVEQDPNDELASALLEKIQVEKNRLIKEGKVKRVEFLTSVKFEEFPFQLEKGWVFCRLGDICNFIDYRGKTPQKVDSGVRLITAKNVRMGFVKDEPLEYISEKTYIEWMTRGFPRYGDILFTTEAPLGNVAQLLTNEKIALAQRAIDLQPYYESYAPYLKCSLMSSVLQSLILEKATGMTAIGIKAAKLKLIPIPLPPLAEQKRIVAKVDELMALCDKLESRRQKKQELQSKLNSAALDRMLSAENQEDFENHWQHICENFDLLYDNPENVEKLKQVILQLAVQGKLVEQNPEDEPASILIEKIEVEKKQLVKEKKIKQIKVDSIEDDDLLFNLPKEWVWSRLGNLCHQVSDGPHFSPNYVSEKEGVPFLSARNIKIERFELDSAKYISFEDHEEFCKRIKPEKGDILYTKGGTTGIAKVNDLDFEFSIWVHVAVLRLAKNFIDPYYLALTLNSPLCYEQSQKFTHGSSNKDLGLTRMINILLPLPPLTEQKRIVEKVEQLMCLCDELEAKLRKEREDSEKLLETVVKGLLESVVDEKTELASIHQCK